MIDGGLAKRRRFPGVDPATHERLRVSYMEAWLLDSTGWSWCAPAHQMSHSKAMGKYP
jgi:hypothetical protein